MSQTLSQQPRCADLQNVDPHLHQHIYNAGSDMRYYRFSFKRNILIFCTRCSYTVPSSPWKPSRWVSDVLQLNRMTFLTRDLQFQTACQSTEWITVCISYRTNVVILCTCRQLASQWAYCAIGAFRGVLWPTSESMPPAVEPQIKCVRECERWHRYVNKTLVLWFLRGCVGQ